jgi:hypothetical protein
MVSRATPTVGSGSTTIRPVGAFDDRDVREREAAHLVNALGDLEQPVIAFSCACRRKLGFTVGRRLGVEKHVLRRIGAVRHRRHESAPRIIEVPSIGERKL